MKILSSALEMMDYSIEVKAEGNKIAFVPTMGALHNGHVSLIEKAKRQNVKVVVSVFVNPTQFNQKSDLSKYPRTFESDKLALLNAKVDVMFYPPVSEVYPVEKTATYDFDGLDKFMEGPNRPGHFDGVIQVVTRLFDLVSPDYAFFGEKDFQQLAIIRHMSSKLKYSTEIIGCPTMREASGLAMSSRNSRLSQEGLKVASSINQVLLGIKNNIGKGENLAKSRSDAIVTLNKTGGLDLEYLELVDSINLAPANDDVEGIQACIAATVEGVRLIDNMRVK